MDHVSESLGRLLARPVGDTLDDLSRGVRAAPGGSAVGLTAALSAALTSGVARSSRSTWVEAGGAIAQAELLRARLCQLTAADADAYLNARGLLSDARGSPQTDPHLDAMGTSRRNHDLTFALSSAAAIPLAIAEAAADVAALAAWACEECTSDERADAVVAATLAEACARGAAELVLVNLGVQGDDTLAVRARRAAAMAGESRVRALASVG
jgi:formiminotetrahydrofolate cyclodeaminase